MDENLQKQFLKWIDENAIWKENLRNHESTEFVFADELRKFIRSL